MIKYFLAALSLAFFATNAPTWAAEKIDGYEVMEDEAARVTDLDQKLARNVKLGPIEFGDYNSEEITLYVYITLLDAVPVKGKVHRIDFRDVSVNEIPFVIDEVGASFEIPSEPPYEIDRPLKVRANWSEAMEGGLAELMNPSANVNLGGKMMVFGKFKGEKKKKNYVVPVEVQIQIPREEIAGRLDELVKQYTIEQYAPQLEALGLDPDDIDTDLIIELLEGWASGEGVEDMNQDKEDAPKPEGTTEEKKDEGGAKEEKGE